ncbi:MAG TPA: biotin--[acetyl-CoA-carboxylase] ligase [Solirubrobacteraceae bacterium]|jgi:BirA family biotin operon repressor/biotin-[acetyl-CoA-carboxylase] ligase|nr:biotin--[acetyl-CoA-carboxylase] ligase [Solirubrobacteraceae bacterium]
MAEPAGSAAADPEHRHEGAALGSPRLHLRSCDSTNERARQLALAGAPHGTLVTAGEQTAGRGRQGRSWVAPPGTCLLCSLVLRWPESSHPPALLPLIAGVAVCEAIGAEARVKWPNDVIFEQPRRTENGTEDDDETTTLAKVAGILVEGRPQEGWAVVGVGVNVAVRLEDLPPDVCSRAATLGRRPAGIEPLLADLLAALSVGLSEQPQQTLAAWRARDALAGRQIAWGQGRGQAQGVDQEGRLLVLTPDGSTVTLSAGDVHLSAAG